MGNYLSTLNPQALISLAGSLTSHLNTPAQQQAYHVDGEDVGDVGLASTEMSTALTTQTNAKNAYHAATQVKDDAKDAILTALTEIAAKIYAAPELTDEMLKAVGLSARTTPSPRPAALAPVTGLVATPRVDGTVTLRWDRRANPRTTMFVVESSADGLGWRVLQTVTRVSLVAEGFAPGVPAWFRVTATSSTRRTPPSASASIYAPSAPAFAGLEVQEGGRKAA